MLLAEPLPICTVQRLEELVEDTTGACSIRWGNVHVVACTAEPIILCGLRVARVIQPAKELDVESTGMAISDEHDSNIVRESLYMRSRCRTIPS